MTQQPNLDLYPIIDEEEIERELNELSKKITSKSTLKNYELERLFHNTFRRKDLTITISKLANEYFGQIRDVVTFVGSDKPYSVIEDNIMMDSNLIVRNFARYLFKHAELYIKNCEAGIVTELVKNYKFGIILTLWNLNNVILSIHQSYQVLIDSDEEIWYLVTLRKIGDYNEHGVEITMSTMACIDFFYFLWILIPLVFTWILTYEVSGDSEDDTIAYGLTISG
ncbi:hypothetical protein RhiirA5_400019 [Rhizophagus irregularis]|uniref:Uncharacterized protein n=1 Tax=Rhizophagus irregularis TaxID=588596 RepID=A0A2N0PJX1_9GLOM|nr:hypothetical protein RhiirA5_400019 [Rhizophagus irregularis]